MENKATASTSANESCKSNGAWRRGFLNVILSPTEELESVREFLLHSPDDIWEKMVATVAGKQLIKLEALRQNAVWGEVEDHVEDTLEPVDLERFSRKPKTKARKEATQPTKDTLDKLTDKLESALTIE